MLSTAFPDTGQKTPKQSRFSTGNNPVPHDGDTAVAPLLARANLLKERGQWEEAIAVCTEAIRRSPNSSSAHSLLGDVYLSQGKNADALHWYRMAINRDPLRNDIKEKYNRLLDEHRAVVTGDFSSTAISNAYRTLIPGDSGDEKTARLPAKPSLAPSWNAKAPTGSGRITAERTLDWFERIFPSRNSGGTTRQLFFIAAVSFTLVLTTATILFLSLRKSDVSDDQTIAAEVRPINPGEVVPPLSTVLPPASAPASVSAIPTPSATLLDHLASLNNQEISVTSAQADPKTSQVQLEIALAPRSGESVQQTRERVLQASAKVARAAFASVPSLQRFAVRVLLRGTGTTGSTDAVNANLVFVGEISGVALRTLNTTGTPTPTLLSSLFTNTWWANYLTVRTP